MPIIVLEEENLGERSLLPLQKIPLIVAINGIFCVVTTAVLYVSILEYDLQILVLVMKMTDIIIIDRDNRLYNYAVQTLSKSYFVRATDAESLQQKGRGYLLDIIRTEHITQIDSDSCVIILGENEQYSYITSDCQKMYVIANSLCDSQIASLKSCNCPVITCGSKNVDSVSFTSICDENVTVSLNRSVTALSGRCVQPLEIPVNYDNEESLYNVLAVTALRILLDDFDSELGRLI